MFLIITTFKMHNNDKRICITEAKAVCNALRKG